ncbi:Asp-tRNA(Asn)/Glu-tRNA(Gln) amidotransferase subunit GatC [Marinospirillum sp.]|uniref:Asp-tRNA(Asn)/Glu-tRNA(Gln) amidotransferase subunit GatC n=1 Tax=Marinospirillum sp. TaxID=2183934 RepID=UPI003A88C7CC
MLTTDDVYKAAQLARLSLEQDKAASTTQAIANILDLVDQMQSLDTTDVEPMAHPMDATQRLRIDEVTEVNQRELLQAQAPAIEQGLFLVPRVIE